MTMDEPDVTQLIRIHDEYSALAAVDPATVHKLQRLRDLDDEWEFELGIQLAQAGYSKAAVEAALRAAGRGDIVDAGVIGDVMG